MSKRITVICEVPDFVDESVIERVIRGAVDTERVLHVSVTQVHDCGAMSMSVPECAAGIGPLPGTPNVFGETSHL